MVDLIIQNNTTLINDLRTTMGMDYLDLSTDKSEIQEVNPSQTVAVFGGLTSCISLLSVIYACNIH